MFDPPRGNHNQWLSLLRGLMGGLQIFGQGQTQGQDRRLRLDQVTRQNARQDREEARQASLDQFNRQQTLRNQDQQDRQFAAGQVERAAQPFEDQSAFANLRANPMQAQQSMPIHLPPIGASPVPTDINPNRLALATAQAGQTKGQLAFDRQQKAYNAKQALADKAKEHFALLQRGNDFDKLLATSGLKFIEDHLADAKDEDGAASVLQNWNLIESLMKAHHSGQPAAAPSAMPGQAGPDLSALTKLRDFGSTLGKNAPAPRPLSDAMGVGGFKPLPKSPKALKDEAATQKTQLEIKDFTDKVADRNRRTDLLAQNADERMRRNQALEKQAFSNAKDLKQHREAMRGLIAAANGIRQGALDETVAYHAADLGLNAAKHNLEVMKYQNPRSSDGVTWTDKQQYEGIKHRVELAEKKLAAAKKAVYDATTAGDQSAISAANDQVRVELKSQRKILEDQQDFLAKARQNQSNGISDSVSSGAQKRIGGLTKQQYIDGALARHYPKDVVMRKADLRYGK